MQIFESVGDWWVLKVGDDLLGPWVDKQPQQMNFEVKFTNQRKKNRERGITRRVPGFAVSILRMLTERVLPGAVARALNHNTYKSPLGKSARRSGERAQDRSWESPGIAPELC